MSDTRCAECGIGSCEASIGEDGLCDECVERAQTDVVTYQRSGTGLPDISLCDRCAGRYEGTLGPVQHGTHRGYCAGERHGISTAAATLGRRGRAVNSPAQQATARSNWCRGGRPRHTETVHITRVTVLGTYGHETTGCDPSGCAGQERYLGLIEDAEAGHVYKIRDGRIVSEIVT